MSTTQAQLTIDWRPTGRDLDYSVADPAKSKENLRRVVKACGYVRDFLTAFFDASANVTGYPTTPVQLNLPVETQPAPAIVSERSVHAPVNGLFAGYALTQSEYAGVYDHLVTILNNGKLRLANMPPKSTPDPVQLRVADAADPNLEDAVLGRKYVIVNGQIICKIGRSLFMNMPASRQEMRFDLTDPNLEGRIYLEAWIDFKV